MNDSRKVGVMIDSGPIQSNLTHMCDAIRNANYKVLDQQGMKPNEEGEYLDKEGENLLMDEDAVSLFFKMLLIVIWLLRYRVRIRLIQMSSPITSGIVSRMSQNTFKLNHVSVVM